LGLDAENFVEYYLGSLFGAVSLDLADRQPDTPIVLEAWRADGRAPSSSASHVTRALTFFQWGTWVETIHHVRVADIARFVVTRDRLGPRRASRCWVTVRADLAPALGLAP
jgi:hypothetical protein